MTGDGTNDAPALAQADVAVAMNTGTQAAKEAGNMVDLDSNPTKLIEIVQIGKQMLITRGSLTTFDRQRRGQVFRHHPRGLRHHLPGAGRAQRDAPGTPAQRHHVGGDFQRPDHRVPDPAGLARRALPGDRRRRLLRRNLLIYGVGGLIVPFIGIKIIDLILVALHLVEESPMSQFRPAVSLLVAMTVITGAAYPLW